DEKHVVGIKCDAPPARGWVAALDAIIAARAQATAVGIHGCDEVERLAAAQREQDARRNARARVEAGGGAAPRQRNPPRAVADGGQLLVESQRQPRGAQPQPDGDQGATQPAQPAAPTHAGQLTRWAALVSRLNDSR